jgi:hypothetical protein
MNSKVRVVVFITNLNEVFVLMVPWRHSYPAGVKLHTRIREVLSSILDRDTCHSDWGFSSISSGPPGKCLEITSNTSQPLPSKSFPIHNSPIIPPSDAMLPKYWQRRKINRKPPTLNPTAGPVHRTRQASSSLLLAFASMVILGVEPHRDPSPYFCSHI